MPAQKGNTYAKGNKGGNPGYGQLLFIKENIKKYSKRWWIEWEKLMKSKKVEDKKFAMVEYNKLQTKLIPQLIGGDKDNPIEVIPILGGKSNVHSNNGGQ